MVYRAEYRNPGGFRRQVALKVLNDEVAGQAEIAQRLRDEARMLGLLNHPAIVKVDDLLELDGRWAIAMEFVEGANLRTLTKALAGTVPLRAAIQITEQVAGALESAYNAETPDGKPLKLLHRDIKPANIQVTLDGNVKVLDFGVARAEFEAREAETRSMRFGSPGYLAPERFLGHDTHEGDMFALGVVLWELACGQRVKFIDPRPNHWEKRLKSMLRTVEEQHPNVPDLAPLLGDLLAFDAEDRPDATTLRKRLRALRHTVDGKDLVEWASPLVQEIWSRMPKKTEELTGLVLAEDDETDHTLTRIRPPQSAVETVRLPPPKARARKRGRRVGLVLVLAGLVVLLAAGVGTLAWAIFG